MNGKCIRELGSYSCCFQLARELLFLCNIKGGNAMDRHEILDLLLKDHNHDSLIERPELYSVEEDIYQWMFETRDEWNKALARLINHYRIDGEELKRKSQNTTGGMK